MKLSSELAQYVDDRTREFDQISSDRKLVLEVLTEVIERELASDSPIRLTFICTHNSRRSHMSQLWAAVAAERYGIRGVETYSGGTEATAFNPRAIASLERAGFQISVAASGENPHYEVRMAKDGSPQICFSKVYNEPPNPQAGYCAVMTCTDADENCPNAIGSSSRVAIPFTDPKASDGTPQEAATYDARCAQIARELLYAFSQVKTSAR